MPESRTGRSPIQGLVIVATVAAFALTACSSTGSSPGTEPSQSSPASPSSTPDASTSAEPAATPVVDPGDGGDYAPQLDPADFVTTIDNPYFPLLPGSRWVYRGDSDGEPERIVVRVTNRSKDVMGIPAVVVRDTVSTSGQVTEDTLDWYAQDVDGNVWYLGETVKDFKNGKLISRAGSWEAGVEGAYAGIVMPADPAVGLAYRQEYWAGEAEDMAEVLDISGTRTVPYGSFDPVVVTRDWNPLDPEVIEEKSYGSGVGMIHETHTAGGVGTARLVQFTPGS